MRGDIRGKVGDEEDGGNDSHGMDYGQCIAPDVDRSCLLIAASVTDIRDVAKAFARMRTSWVGEEAELLGFSIRRDEGCLFVHGTNTGSEPGTYDEFA